MSFLSAFWSNIKSGKNIDVYLALFFGIVATLIGIFGASVDIVVSITAGILALVAFGMLADRNETQRTAALLNHLARDVSNSSILAKRGERHEEIVSMLANAKSEICILVRYGGFIHRYSVDIETAVKRGVDLKVIVCEPTREVVSMLALRGYSVLDPRDILTRWNGMVINLKGLAGIVSGNPGYGKMRVRTIRYMTAMRLVITDPDSPGGKIFAQIASFGTSSTQAASVNVDRRQDEDLFLFMTTEFENYWHKSQPIIDTSDDKDTSQLLSDLLEGIERDIDNRRPGAGE